MKAARFAAPLLVIALGVGCAGPRTTVPAESIAASDALSNWRFEPLSWAKLEAIEVWLDRTYDAPQGLRAEAELQLAEGRLTFAERERSELSARVLKERAERCAEGFERVIADAQSSRDQRARARSGLERIAGIGRAPSAVPAQTGGALARSAWRAGPPDPNRLTPHKGPWSRITVHHSVVEPNDSSIQSTAQLLRSIQRDHMTTQGMGDIGYHFLIDSTGHVVEGRSMRWRGAHAGGSNNNANVGVCLLGNFETQRPTRASLQALAKLTEELRGRFGIRRSAVFGHKELKGTACPGLNLQRWVNSYRAGSAPLAGVLPESNSGPLSARGRSSSGRSASVR